MCDVAADRNCLFSTLGSIVQPKISAAEVDGEESDVLWQRPAEIEEGTWGKAVDIFASASTKNVTTEVLYLNLSSPCDSMLLKFYPIDEHGRENRQAPVLNNLVIHTGHNHFGFGYFV